jgi:tRNA pseudouridine55 synthase
MNIVVNLNKCKGITSHDAVAAVKRVFKVRKAGHTGTLDPLATGLMLVCLNEATKIAALVEALEKEYVATVRLGAATDTYDSEGRVTRSADPSAITVEAVKSALQEFIGEIDQVPPMYSAIKVSGQPLYKLARKGIEVERKARRIVVSAIDIVEFANPDMVLRISCSKGTYIRSICHDLGASLKVGAHMTGLVRTRIGDFRIEDSAAIDQLPHKTEALFSADSALARLPELRLAGDDLKKAQNGNPLSLWLLDGRSVESGTAIRLKDIEGKLIGIGKVGRDSIKIHRLLFL